MDKVAQANVNFFKIWEGLPFHKSHLGMVNNPYIMEHIIKEIGAPFTIHAHRNWAAGEWVEKGLDIPAPHVGETWLCNLHDIGPGIIGRRLIATPVEFLSWELVDQKERKLLKQEVENDTKES